MAAPIFIAAAMERSSSLSSTTSSSAFHGGFTEYSEQRKASLTESRYDHLVKLASGRVKCNLCNSTYSCLISARAHTVRVHEQPEYFECSLCTKIFRTKLNFRSHLNLSHGIKGSNLVAKYGRLVDMVDDYNELMMTTNE